MLGPMHGRQEAAVRIFFSPTCPSCHHILSYFLPNDKGGLALMPIAKKPNQLQNPGRHP
ncbi:hypothetical protein DSUL_50370 [Desulfovibrionales bacterium]